MHCSRVSAATCSSVRPQPNRTKKTFRENMNFIDSVNIYLDDIEVIEFFISKSFHSTLPNSYKLCYLKTLTRDLMQRKR
jgi:hypothetical protein